eukprot:4003639-Pyramimonas_sp.AAC.1
MRACNAASLLIVAFVGLSLSMESQPPWAFAARIAARALPAAGILPNDRRPCTYSDNTSTPVS